MSNSIVVFLEASKRASKIEKKFRKKHGRKMTESEHEANMIFHAFLAVLNLSLKK